ncbi:MAG: arginine--tRNA ligase [Chitinophagaceae bacterium]|nr:arginine--tRNA ligase [Chitinophagaceae bacterium]
MQVADVIRTYSVEALQAVYGVKVLPEQVTISETKPEFTGDYTLVLFPFVKQLRQSPDAIGKALGEWLVANLPHTVSGFETVKGFLNLSIAHTWWITFLQNSKQPDFGFAAAHGRKVMVEYSSPNTNKPLHLGHLRNNFLGWSVAEIFKANGYDVMKTCVVNDRGVHICKSMLAWQKFGQGATPQSTGTKGDHLVGDYYVLFENELRQQAEPLLAILLEGKQPAGMEPTIAAKAEILAQKLQTENLPADKVAEIKDELKEIARNATPIMAEVRDMLRRWEQGDAETLRLWRTMNGWVYEGFDATYSRIGSRFDKIYYESDTYLLGKQYIDAGLEQGVFYKKEDGSVWIDLTAEGLDEKLVLRRDGTSVYITQDIGLAMHKYADFAMEKSLYVIGDEQNYHMKVLELICKKLGMPFAEGIHHLSYGMVDLPTGRMKSREGTVVDADDLCDEMEKVAADKTQELGKVDGFTEAELKVLYHTLGMGALKFYLLRVDPKKRMVFNPEESIDFHGFTGPFVQYTYARIQSVLKKAEYIGETEKNLTVGELLPLEKEQIRLLEQFPATVRQACTELSPAVIANYVYAVAKTFNSFYAGHSIKNAENEAKRQLRLEISYLTGVVIRNGMQLLGIAVPERM